MFHFPAACVPLAAKRPPAFPQQEAWFLLRFESSRHVFGVLNPAENSPISVPDSETKWSWFFGHPGQVSNIENCQVSR
jgi:hypothetical protein